MTLRFIGLLLIVIVSVLWGKEKGDYYKNLSMYREGFLALITESRRQILCYRLTMDEIALRFDHEFLKNSGFISDMRRLGIEKAYILHQKDFEFDPHLHHKLLDYFRSFGTHSVTDQLMICEGLIQDLQEQADKSRKDYPQKQKLYFTLGATVGIGIMILLI